MHLLVLTGARRRGANDRIGLKCSWASVSAVPDTCRIICFICLLSSLVALLTTAAGIIIHYCWSPSLSPDARRLCPSWRLCCDAALRAIGRCTVSHRAGLASSELTDTLLYAYGIPALPDAQLPQMPHCLTIPYNSANKKRFLPNINSKGIQDLYYEICVWVQNSGTLTFLIHGYFLNMGTLLFVELYGTRAWK